MSVDDPPAGDVRAEGEISLIVPQPDTTWMTALMGQLSIDDDAQEPFVLGGMPLVLPPDCFDHLSFARLVRIARVINTRLDASRASRNTPVHKIAPVHG